MKLLKYLRNLLLALFILSIGSVVLFRFVPVPFTPLMLINSGINLLEGKPATYKHEWVDIEDISPNLVAAVVASEDQLFYDHHGFDFNQIEKAIEERKEGKRKRGGSTISQQTAKNIFTTGSSTWFRKGVEAYFTVCIELLWSKERIMEVYLNSIEMGTNIYGAEAAAQAHFNTTAKKLTRRQSALIAASLPNPHRYNAGKPSKYVSKRQQQILKQMRNMGK